MKTLLRFAIHTLPYALTALWYFSWGQDLAWQAVLLLWIIVFITDVLAHAVGYGQAKNISAMMFQQMYNDGLINKAELRKRAAERQS